MLVFASFFLVLFSVIRYSLCDVLLMIMWMSNFKRNSCFCCLFFRKLWFKIFVTFHIKTLLACCTLVACFIPMFLRNTESFPARAFRHETELSNIFLNDCKWFFVPLIVETRIQLVGCSLIMLITFNSFRGDSGQSRFVSPSKSLPFYPKPNTTHDNPSRKISY